mmetsp:Transcript_31966/g.72947  ORF Transcript_31966/g.72947 Transcript_31966/m.72947 type:complete len:222 (-) Transcript_31966:167-832(-)
MPRLAVVFVLPLVDLAIRPNHAALTTHPAQLPLASINATISKGVPALSIHRVHSKLTLKRRFVCGSVEAISILLAIHVLSLESGAIEPGLYPSAMLQILLPFAPVGAAVSMQVSTEAVSHVVRPLALVNVTIEFDKASSTSSSVVLELTLVDSDPLLLNSSTAMPFATKPLSSVEGQLAAVFYSSSWSLLEKVLCTCLLTLLRDNICIGDAGAHPSKPNSS